MLSYLKSTCTLTDDMKNKQVIKKNNYQIMNLMMPAAKKRMNIDSKFTLSIYMILCLRLSQINALKAPNNKKVD